MKEILGYYVRTVPSVLREKIAQEVDAGLRSLRLAGRSKEIRRAVDMGIRGIEVEPIPPCLAEGENAILVSNYPSVSKTVGAVLKVACRLPGERLRLKAIGRKEVIAEAGLWLRAIGVDWLVFPAIKDEVGRYMLEPQTLKEVLAYLSGEGNVLWLSITGKTRGNGLLESDLRTGAALFSLKKRVQIVPMGLMTKGEGRELRIVKVRFGEPLNPPEHAMPWLGKLSEFEMGDFLVDISRLIMCRIAALLPAGQRGDFEDVDDKLREVRKRLGWS